MSYKQFACPCPPMRDGPIVAPPIAPKPTLPPGYQLRPRPAEPPQTQRQGLSGYRVVIFAATVVWVLAMLGSLAWAVVMSIPQHGPPEAVGVSMLVGLGGWLVLVAPLLTIFYGMAVALIWSFGRMFKPSGR